MKKVLSLLLVLALLLPAFAVAEGVDLSALSFDQLVQLREQIARELTTRPEWKEVTVPQGVWEVGVDIPAGHWTITVANRGYGRVTIAPLLKDNGLEVDYWKALSQGLFHYQITLTGRQSGIYDPQTSVSSFDIELPDGVYVEVYNASVIFSPYTGKPSLGF